jgi:hypothetical protein
MDKMKNTPVVMIVLGIFISLLFLQFSCGTMKEHRSEEIPAEAEEMPEEALLLENKHEAAGIGCNDCHQETPPAEVVPKEVCLACHEDYKELVASYPDPHNAHITYAGCGDCHHVHRQSENACLGCHDFNLQAP